MVIWGPPGAGKTTYCHNRCKELGFKPMHMNPETMRFPRQPAAGIIIN